MRVLIKSNNPVQLNFAQSLLKDAGIAWFLFDEQMSVMEGSLGVLPRRLMVADEDYAQAADLVRENVPDLPVEIVSETTLDTFLNGRVSVRQTRTGFRAGLDAVMLAAAVPAVAGDAVLELGAGAGTASLCVAARVPDCMVTGVEIDAALASLANDNAQANDMALRVTFLACDIFDLPSEVKREFAHVLCNPPFHHGGEVSPDIARDRALRDRGELGAWMETGLKRTISGGTFTAIVRADRMSEALARLPDRGVSILPLWPRPGEPAKRIILQTRKGSRATSALLPGLVLHNPDGSYTAEAERVLRDAAPLATSL